MILSLAAAVGLILFVAFVGSRLARARKAGFSIRMQVFLALAIIIGAFALGLGLLVLDRIEARTTLLAEEAARDEAAVVVAIVAGEIDEPRVTLQDMGRKLAQARDHGGGELHVTLLEPNGNAVFSSGPRPDEPGMVVVTVPVVVRGAEVGTVRVVKPTIVIRRTLEDFAPTILLISVVLGAAAAVSAVLIGRTIASPIEALTEFAVRVSEGERRAPPPPAYGREVQRLSRAIDSMRRELEGRPFVETFAADLSHELKNPVAAIRASAEVLADGALDEPEEASRFVARIQEATSRIENLLGDLLSLARIEARGVEQLAVLDLTELTRKVAARARERGGKIEIVADSGAAVRGDPVWLIRALENLVDNARTHGQPDDPVRIELSRRSEEVIVAVRNRGQIGKHVEKRLFKRFVTTRADRGGTGLGLAIVRAIAEAHSGSAECVLSGPPDVEFRITLPGA